MSRIANVIAERSKIGLLVVDEEFLFLMEHFTSLGAANLSLIKVNEELKHFIGVEGHIYVKPVPMGPTISLIDYTLRLEGR